MQTDLPQAEHFRLKEVFHHQNSVRGRSLYLAAITLLTLFLVLLPVIEVPLSVQGRGMISRDSTHIAEVYISGKDIVHLYKNQKVRIQVDAFNYNEWGFVPARILTLSEELVVLENQPLLRVQCALDRNYLKRQNGMKGMLRKGMTVNAVFPVARKSLFQLLYQKADDRMNPSRSRVN
ncbi:MAG: hypothetical protein JW801_08130 [Bacteroidales bacterium]|nr:hypothetical protein [Bacteroidales bacterium]